MGLLNILNTVKAITDFASDEKTVEAFSNFKKLGDGLGMFIDTNKDGQFTMNDFNTLLEVSQAYASIIGHVSTLEENELSDDELDAGLSVINNLCFSENGFLNDKIIEFSGMPKKQIKNNVFDKISNPISLKKISKEAITIEKEEEFYKIACSVVYADKIITQNERDFLDHFAKELGLSKFDVKVIEKQFKV